MELIALIVSIVAIVVSALSALYTRAQARTAAAALAHETEARLRISMSLRFEHPEGTVGEGASTDTVWHLVNEGRGAALKVSVALDTDKNGERYGHFLFERLGPGERVLMQPKRGTTLPNVTNLVLGTDFLHVTARWQTPDGKARTARFVPGI